MNSSESWGLEVDPSIFKALKKIPRPDAEAVLKVIKLLPIDPYFGDIQKMKGKDDVWRRRVGAYRIFYKIKTEMKVVLVFELERRGSKTY